MCCSETETVSFHYMSPDDINKLALIYNNNTNAKIDDIIIKFVSN